MVVQNNKIAVFFYERRVLVGIPRIADVDWKMRGDGPGGTYGGLVPIVQRIVVLWLVDKLDSDDVWGVPKCLSEQFHDVGRPCQIDFLVKLNWSVDAAVRVAILFSWCSVHILSIRISESAGLF